MFKQTMTLALVVLCLTLSSSGWAGIDPYVTALTGNIWEYSAFVFDPKEGVAGWHTGVVNFYLDYTVDIRTVGSSGNFDPTTILHLKYSVDNNGRINITSPDFQDAYPYIGGQISPTLDKISAVVTSNNAGPNQVISDPSPGNVILTRVSTVTFSYLDLMGQWGGSAFVNNGSGVGWLSIDNLSIDAQGNITGNDTRFDGKSGAFTGRATISQNGQIKMTIANVQDPNYPIVMTAQMSQSRGMISADFNSAISGQTSLGIGLMFKK